VIQKLANKYKTKGKYLEDKVAKIIRENLNLSPADVHRNQTSGVFHWEFGDIYFRKLAWIIECKNRQEVELKNLYPNLKPVIEDWYKQLKKDVFKFKQKVRNECVYCLCVSNSSQRLPIYAIVDQQSYLEFVKKNLIGKFNHFILTSNGYVITTLEEFTKQINLEKLTY